MARHVKQESLEQVYKQALNMYSPLVRLMGYWLLLYSSRWSGEIGSLSHPCSLSGWVECWKESGDKTHFSHSFKFRRWEISNDFMSNTCKISQFTCFFYFLWWEEQNSVFPVCLPPHILLQASWYLPEWMELVSRHMKTRVWLFTNFLQTANAGLVLTVAYK